MPPGGSLSLQQTITGLLAARVSIRYLVRERLGLIVTPQPNHRPSTGDVLASSHFAQWLSDKIQDASLVISVIPEGSRSYISSPHETRNGRGQMLDERAQKLDEREAIMDGRFADLKNREIRLAGRDASLEAKLNRYIPPHASLHSYLLADYDI